MRRLVTDGAWLWAGPSAGFIREGFEVTCIGRERIPAKAIGLRLYRHDKKDRLIACELVVFDGGAAAIDTVLRRAGISGRVEVGGAIKDHFADIYVNDHTWEESVALDAGSYGALKNRWMRCRVESADE